jgi:hypothetical protein
MKAGLRENGLLRSSHWFARAKGQHQIEAARVHGPLDLYPNILTNTGDTSEFPDIPFITNYVHVGVNDFKGPSDEILCLLLLHQFM